MNDPVDAILAQLEDLSLEDQLRVLEETAKLIRNELASSK